MKHCILLSVFLLALSAAPGAAEPIVFGTAEVVTSGLFSCKAAPQCSASGSSVVLGTGDSAVTVTFTPVSTLVPMSNYVVPVTLGTFSATSNSATFPTRTNPNVGIVRFSLTLTHTSPVADHDSLFMEFGPGGRTTLPFLMGETYFSLNPGLAGYNSMIYSLAPFRFSIPMNGSVDVTANAGVVPEPGTLALVGLGLAGAAARRRKRSVPELQRRLV